MKIASASLHSSSVCRSLAARSSYFMNYWLKRKRSEATSFDRLKILLDASSTRDRSMRPPFRTVKVVPWELNVA